MNRLGMVRGDSATITVTLTDEEGYPLDVDLLSAVTFTARRSYDSGEPLIRKTLGAGVEPGDGADQAVVTLEPADTSGLAATVRLVWDVQVEATEPEEVTHTVARGYLWVHRDAGS